MIYTKFYTFRRSLNFTALCLDDTLSSSQKDGGGKDLAGGGLGHGLTLIHLPTPHGHPHRGHRVQLLEDRVRGGGREDPGVPVEVLTLIASYESAPVIGVDLDQLFCCGCLILSLKGRYKHIWVQC